MVIARELGKAINHHLKRGKSLLLLGPRQVGKSTLLRNIPADLTLLLSSPKVRQNYERTPGLLAQEIGSLSKSCPLIILDEIQKVPTLLDEIQGLIDSRSAQFILTGSSARKLKKGASLNLLPGRLVHLRLDTFSVREWLPPISDRPLEQILYDGQLPGICLNPNTKDRQIDLASYIEAYLEEEVRQEALVRNLGPFSRFLELAALESGHVTNFAKLSKELGPSTATIASYYEILADCLIMERVEPITGSRTRKKLTKASKMLFFDLGVRRVAAREGHEMIPSRLGEIFEQFIGMECIKWLRQENPGSHLRFWRDPDGPEVDWVCESGGRYLPIEVKWNPVPSASDAKHLRVFLQEYPKQAGVGLIVCPAVRARKLDSQIHIIPWQDLGKYLRKYIG